MSWTKCRHRQLQIFKGRLKNIDAGAEGKFEILYTVDGVENEIAADAMINYIGSESNFKRIDSELIRNLNGRGYIKNDALNLGIDALPDGKHLMKSAALQTKS